MFCPAGRSPRGAFCARRLGEELLDMAAPARGVVAPAPGELKPQDPRFRARWADLEIKTATIAIKTRRFDRLHLPRIQPRTRFAHGSRTSIPNTIPNIAP